EQSGQIKYTAYSEADGTYTISDVVPGTYLLVGIKSGYHNWSQSKTISSGQNLTDQNIAMYILSCGTLELTAYSGSEIYSPPYENYQYRYGPSIILNGNTVDMWASAPDPSPDAWDRIEHRRGTIDIDGTIQWETDWEVALQRTPNSRDKYSTCDPGVFYLSGYYYIGYTSTDQESNGGASSNDVFVARCNDLPDGSQGVSCEKWNGNGWGGNPQPIIEYNGPEWGIGQPSFVVKDNILFIYYTDNGTKLALADATDENWPLTLYFIENPILINERDEIILGGKPGPFEVKYIDDLDKFIGIGVSFEFNPQSNIFVYESNDGLNFTPIVTSRDYWEASLLQDRAHNVGLSGDIEGHIQLNVNNFIAYGFGRPNRDPNAEYNARWPTYLNPISIHLGDVCEGDFDGDGDVDGTDLFFFAADFGRTDCDVGDPCEGDFDGDDDVDGSDLAIFAEDFGKTDCPQ
ncbi:MAG: carboxypeptidase-like regulatory domain-containing protein, partial [Thermodesulfobacteriota bacterium]|nr:carboxypeptidase-like regulatory domain-containing protein [Thermodesulfobacteriota bacterium]